jgi:glutamate formiminotransferase/formiminotetrahydrofolate cyclodeaminase
MKIVECVPNFSEGRDRKIIDRIAAEISSVSGVRLLDVDPGFDANRTVITFAGEAGSVAEAAFRAVAAAAGLIDMRGHRGAHPRMGATDVCPFIPVSGITMDECVELSRRVAERVGRELRIPVFLYEHSATAEHRRRLADIRRGEYEGLSARMKDGKWKPDFGPPEPNEKSGATVMGARFFLIAYNVNLSTTNTALARKIAKQVREKKDGTGLKSVRAIGWDMPEYGCAQISMNLVNYHETPPHAAFEEIRRIAREMGLRVTGSELVGLIPMEAMLMAGRFYLEKQNRSGGQPFDDVIRTAVQSLGLSDAAAFDPDARILERRLMARPLADRTVAGYFDALSSDRPSPGGGTAAALSSSMGAGLIAMVAGIGYKKQKDAGVKAELDRAAVEAQTMKERFLDLALRDEAAYNGVVAAHGLPSKSEEQKRARSEAAALALRRCIEVPVEVLDLSIRALGLLESIIEHCPPAAASDTAAALNCLHGGACTARRVAMINLKDESLPAADVQELSKKLDSCKGAVDGYNRTIEAAIQSWY